MPDYIVDITHQYGAVLYEWGNRYIVHANDLTDAASAVPLIVAQETLFHSEAVAYIQARVATVEANDGVYVTIPLGDFGQITDLAVPLPAITTVNIEVQVAGFGRPGRKYYHPFLSAAYGSTTVPFTWLNSYLEEVQNDVITMIDNLTTNGTPLVRDADHEWLQAVTVHRVFGYHQFTKQSPRPSP